MQKRALEVMAGYGRNLPALELFFKLSNVELQDGCKDLLEIAQKEMVGKSHRCLLHEFKADYSQYGLVLGVWALCYLKPDDVLRFVSEASAADTLIFIEPIITITKRASK